MLEARSKTRSRREQLKQYQWLVAFRGGHLPSLRQRARRSASDESANPPLPPSLPHQTRPSSGHLAPFVGCMAASADALLLFVPVAGDAPASSVAMASARRPRLARPENDGRNNASAHTNRADAPDANRAFGARGSQTSYRLSRKARPNAQMRMPTSATSATCWRGATTLHDAPFDRSMFALMARVPRLPVEGWLGALAMAFRKGAIVSGRIQQR